MRYAEHESFARRGDAVTVSAQHVVCIEYEQINEAGGVSRVVERDNSAIIRTHLAGPDFIREDTVADISKRHQRPVQGRAKAGRMPARPDDATGGTVISI